jgi:hypothetical protein
MGIGDPFASVSQSLAFGTGLFEGETGRVAIQGCEHRNIGHICQARHARWVRVTLRGCCAKARHVKERKVRRAQKVGRGPEAHKPLVLGVGWRLSDDRFQPHFGDGLVFLRRQAAHPNTAEYALIRRVGDHHSAL